MIQTKYNTFDCKESVDINHLMHVHPNLLLLFSAFCIKAFSRNMPVRITSIIDVLKVRVSKTHEEGRAIDISAKGWHQTAIDEMLKELNNEYRSIAAVSAKTLIPQAVVYHEVVQGGTSYGKHFHLQVKP